MPRIMVASRAFVALEEAGRTNVRNIPVANTGVNGKADLADRSGELGGPFRFILLV
jgi:hypothetical protein